MNKIIILLLTLTLAYPIYAETIPYSELVERDGLLYKYSVHKDGKKLIFEGELFTGKARGKKGIGRVKNGKEEGIWKRFYTSGQLEWKNNYKDGKLHCLSHVL